MTGADDLGPLQLASRAPKYLFKRARRTVATRYYARRFARQPDHPSLDDARAAALLADADRVLFLCWGNVCRSPMAEGYLRNHLDSRDADLVVDSAGLGERAGRASPPLAVDVAAEYGVDLSGHRSRLATDADLAASDVVFLMDFHNYHLLRADLSAAAAPVFFLSAFAPGTDAVEIPDPNGQSRDAYEAIFDTIADAVDEIAAVVGGSDRVTARE